MQISSFAPTDILFRPSQPGRRQKISTNTPKGIIRGTNKTLFLHFKTFQDFIFSKNKVFLLPLIVMLEGRETSADSVGSAVKHQY